MSLKCVVIDDEQYAIDAMVGYINKITDLDVFTTYVSALDALTNIKKEDNIDFIFLDIEMPEISGLELAKSLRDKTKFLVFTTGHPSYALNAFDLNASQYLLKPISFAKFATTIDYILKDLTIVNSSVQVTKSRLQFIKADNKSAYHYIDSTEIIYIEAAKNYVLIYTGKEKFVTHMGLNHIETALDPKYFIRVNKSNIIAKNAIKKVEGHTIILNNTKTLQLGDVYKPAFQDFLNGSLLKAGF
ncbi:response regulator transcription factor [Pedobacter frigiditerrae]|uniref:Response regulator transcription factor n=1 Tax=Pedobacter frigiditerrae TaxID=2530452 RepID=A0A4V2MIT0_9SPHI|nr:LytTR family DNA-binding domain-containing protein [Pedobacter frigiditerrae]TCC91686.1 response regulator transcription factor [Pedobacter frigiditerrae]